MQMNPPPVASGVRKFIPLAIMLVSAIVALAAYWQTLDYPFAYDDLVYIPNNAKLIGLHASELWHLFTEPYNDFSEFLPLRDFSYWLDMTLFGLAPSAFRVHSILLFLLCLPLVYANTSKLWCYFRPAQTVDSKWIAAVVTALFALHPTLVEPVVWVGGRKDIQAALFSLLAVWFAMQAHRKNGLSTPYALSALVALLAAMLSKATAVAVSPLIAILWIGFWCDIPKFERRRAMLLWPCASLVLAGCIAKIFATIIPTKVPLYFGIEAITRSLAILGWMSRLAVSPENRQVFYPVFEYPHFSIMVAIGAVVLIAVAVGGILSLRKRSLEGFALMAFFLLCMPSLQLIPYMPPSLVSDRFLALAVWPALILIVGLMWRLRPLLRSAVVVVIALFWGAQITERSREWHNFEAVLDTNLRAYPETYMPAYFKITDFQLKREQYPDAMKTASGITLPELKKLMFKMIVADQAVFDLASNDPQKAMTLLWELGTVLKNPPVQAQWDSPIKVLWEMNQISLSNEWTALAKRFPENASVRYTYGLWLMNVPKFEFANEEFRTAIDSNQLPASMRGEVFKNLGFSLMKSGHFVEAEDSLRAALEQSLPDLRAYCLLSDLYKQSGRIMEAQRAGAACRQQAQRENF